MHTLLQDFRFALRTLRKSPVFAAVAICSLALGIGANTAIFTLIDQVLLRMLPVKEPERLVLLDGPGARRGAIRNDNAFSYPMYVDLRNHNEVFDGMLARFPTDLSVSFRNQTERANGELVSGNYFEILGVKPIIGRTLTPDDDKVPGAHPVTVLTYGYWQRRFGLDPGVLNQTVNVNGHPMTIVGILAPGFHGVEVGSSIDLMVPMMMKAQMTPTWDDMKNRSSFWLNIFARLKPGVSREQAAAAMNVVYHQILESELPQLRDVNERFRKRFLEKKLVLLDGQKGKSSLRRQFSQPLVVLMSMVGLVLLIACANVANLLMARAAARQKEVAIRLALGASRAQIIRQLLVESLTLALIGGLGGILVSLWTGQALVNFLPFEGAARTLTTTPDLRVLLFTLGLSVLTGLLFGLVPALQSTRPALAKTLKDEAGSVSSVASAIRLRKTLVVAQVALSLLLLIGAGLFARSLYNLKNMNPGFQTQNLTTFTVDATLNGYDRNRGAQFYQQLQEQLRTMPGVQVASLAAVSALTDNNAQITTSFEGYQPKEGEDMNPSVNWIAPQYFAAMGMPLIAGRDFTDRDLLGAPKVAIISEKTARMYFGKENPIGKHIGIGGGTDAKLDREVVGVVRDVRATTLRDEVKRFIYYPYLQEQEMSQMSFYIRTSQPVDQFGTLLRQTVRRIDPNIPVYELKSMQLVLDESLFTDRIVATLSAFFGLLATLLAAVGLYGVMAYTVARRTREIGIRIALGAAKMDVIGMVMREVTIMAGLGIFVGLPAAYVLSRLIESQLFGLTAHDPFILGICTLVLTVVALLAGAIPAERATRIDPQVALRYE